MDKLTFTVQGIDYHEIIDNANEVVEDFFRRSVTEDLAFESYDDDDLNWPDNIMDYDLDISEAGYLPNKGGPVLFSADVTVVFYDANQNDEEKESYA